jgi:hypothetical protein
MKEPKKAPRRWRRAFAIAPTKNEPKKEYLKNERTEEE